MSQVVVGKIEAVGEMEVGEAALYGAVEVLRPPKCGDLRMTRVLEMGAMTEIAERDG